MEGFKLSNLLIVGGFIFWLFFGIKAIIIYIKKNGNAKKTFMYSGVSFVVMFVGGAIASSSTEQVISDMEEVEAENVTEEEQRKAEEETKKQEEEEQRKAEEEAKKQEEEEQRKAEEEAKKQEEEEQRKAEEEAKKQEEEEQRKAEEEAKKQEEEEQRKAEEEARKNEFSNLIISSDAPGIYDTKKDFNSFYRQTDFRKNVSDRYDDEIILLYREFSSSGRSYNDTRNHVGDIQIYAEKDSGLKNLSFKEAFEFGKEFLPNNYSFEHTSEALYVDKNSDGDTVILYTEKFQTIVEGLSGNPSDSYESVSVTKGKNGTEFIRIGHSPGTRHAKRINIELKDDEDTLDYIINSYDRDELPEEYR
ncbi:hypothetical protein [Bacillus sp. FJAT-44742]|uniref:hypothetical protein n=1 Tax=Bacillus sp. FJAT-44742 TaxID=2014005 RepID=UPI000C23B7CE|nr:hypothetical protein [Bacillus sp. FJAT-44742]